MGTPSLVEHFRNYFEVIPANTPELLEQVFRIRFDVYCREFGYEREEDCPGGMERDEYDDRAAHCLIVHRASRVGAGCIRVIQVPDDQPDFQLPIERFCGKSLIDPIWHPARLPRERVAEVSRLAVHTSFRRRQGETESPAGLALREEFLTEEEERRTFPLLGLALFCAGCCLMIQHRRDEAFVMMERRLARRLQSCGFPFRQVGEVMEYHGPRAAYHVPTHQVLEAMQNETRELYEFVYQSLEEEMRRG